ncbi:MAG TPA: glycoside hydrolase family 15 protein [Actinomycetota bacterium]|nr:glycoside hydrolase family 15 protein [Actinomycetota bacterium]
MPTSRGATDRYPPIADYALIGDCHSAALVSRTGSIDWCCMPRFDSGSVFGRLLDWDRGGHCTLSPRSGQSMTHRSYIDDTSVLVTTFRGPGGEARVFDCFTMRRGGARNPYQQLIRVIEGIRGRVNLDLVVAPRFDFGEVRPWIRQHGHRLYSAIGGNNALVVAGDPELTPTKSHDLTASISIRAGERSRLSIQFVRPELLDSEEISEPSPEEIDRRLQQTIEWWRRWVSRVGINGPLGAPVKRSAIVLKCLTNAPTGAIMAAPTTSLPEVPGGSRNWDYRYSWVRDSSFTVRAFAELGCEAEADGFRRFIERSAAGSAEDLQILYGAGGERRLVELVLEEPEGYRGARPVRIGNAATGQLQLDAYGTLLDLAWRWHLRGHSPDDDYWRFLVDLVDSAALRWREPDRGIWEVRGPPKHFVHSKVMCWSALEAGLRLSRECSRRAPERKWRMARNEVRRAIESKGYDRKRGIFVRSFGSRDVDAALLLLPTVDFVDYEDDRMIRTVDVIMDKLMDDGLLRRYRAADGLKGEEGVFLPASFWLAECLAHQGRRDEAVEVFDRAVSTGNDLGLFSEEFDQSTGEMLGNFPQGLTHLSHISAAMALGGSGLEGDRG